MEKRQLSAEDKGPGQGAGTLKNFRKKASKYGQRQIEVLGQSLGKKDKTEDAYFDYNVDNFERQQANAAKLQK